MPSQVISPKRKAIADSSRAMFMWIAAMSAVIGICVVVGIAFAKQIFFKAEVVGKMTETLNILKDNNKVSSTLTSNILVLEANGALNSAKATPEEKALQVVLDALPADRNALSLGASLQQNLLTDVDGLSIELLSVDGETATPTGGSSENTIPIKLQVKATSANAIKDMLLRLERSIRIIDIDSFNLERNDEGYVATIGAHAYYQPEKKVELTQKQVPEGKKNEKK